MNKNRSNQDIYRGLIAAVGLVLLAIALGRCSDVDAHNNSLYLDSSWASVAVSALATIISLVAVVLVYLTLSHQRDSAQRQLRAYVSFISADLIVPLGGQPRVRVVVQNNGQTPAYDLEIICGIGYRVPNLPEELSVEGLKIEGSVSTLGPKVETSVEVEIAGQPIVNQALIDELKKGGEYAVRVIGRCRYRDAFEKTRQTSWRLYSAWLRQGFVMHPAATGNQAT